MNYSYAKIKKSNSFGKLDKKSQIDKIINISNFLYNNGLEKAKQNDLSGAIECLTKSLDFNKKHIESRNLLGLIYLEIGLVGNALNEFNIGRKINKDNIKAEEFFNNLKNENSGLQKYQEAIEAYNQSLVYLNQKSEDMAIIQLRKAVDINPKFIEANNLLALCYIITKNDNLAITTINKILTIDCFNKKALLYKDKLKNPNLYVSSTKKEKKEFSNPVSSPYTKYLSVNKNNFGTINVFSAIFFFSGIMICLLFFYLLVIPSISSKNSVLINKYRTENSELTNKINLLEEENSTKIKELTAKTAQLEKDKKDLEEKVSIQDKIQTLNDASDFINKGNYEEGSILLKTIDKEGLPEELISKYDDMVLKSFPRTANLIYQRGISKYRAKAYEEAENVFKDCLKYADINSSQYGDSLYYLGEIALVNGDEESAKRYFETVVNDYKDIAKNYWSARNKVK